MALCGTVCRGLPSEVHHFTGDPAAHVVAVVGATEVVGREPGVGLDLELQDRVEAALAEDRSPALVEDCLAEMLDDVVIPRTRRDARDQSPGRPGRRGTHSRSTRGHCQRARPHARPVAARVALNPLKECDGPWALGPRR